MKKFLCLFLLVTMLVIPASVNVSAFYESDGFFVFDSEGNHYATPSSVVIGRCLPRDTEVTVDSYYAESGDNQIPEDMLTAVMNEALEGEYFGVFDLHVDGDEPYPEVESVEIELEDISPSGTMRSLNDTNIGKDYRICFVDEDFTISPVEDCIMTQGVTHVRFEVNRLGKYVVYFNPEVCDITFFTESPNYDEDTDDLLNPEECIYHEIVSLKYHDTYELPEPPEKEGFVFVGWQEKYYFGKSLVCENDDIGKAFAISEFYANWVSEEDHEPFVVKAETVGTIKKGSENDKKVRITISHGAFDDECFPENWYEIYESADEEDKPLVLAEWKRQWGVVGNDELLIKNVEKIDDKTIELTLLGNSSDTDSSSNIAFSFPNWIIYNSENENHPYQRECGQLNEYGFEKEIYVTDNTIKLYKKSSGGGGGGASTVLVSFETNGGEKQDNLRYAWGEKAELPVPVKEGFVFGGWYTDSGLTQKADTSFKKSATLYAKWVPENKEENQLIMYVGKDSAKAFGKEISGVAPVKESGRLYLPLRFVAESFGGKVGWNNDTKQITVTYLDNSAVIDLENMTASANGFTVNVEGELFVINSKGRTYISADFVNKILGNIITFDAKTNMIIIEK